MEFELVESKGRLREQFKEQICGLSEGARVEASQAIRQKVASLLQNEEGVWALYSPMADEPDLTPLVSQPPGQVQWVLPRIEGERELGFYKANDQTQLETNSWGLNQPVGMASEKVSLSEIKGFVIPALAYDGSGYRLGRGGGFYDQVLKNYNGRRVGVIFDLSFSRRPLPKDSFDEPVEVIISPKQWVEVKG